MESPSSNLRVMLDANILIAGIVWPRWSYEIIQHALRGDYDLVLCDFVINQARRHIRSRFQSFLGPFEEFMQASRYEKAEDPSKEELLENSSLVWDITDVPVVLTAIHAKVDILVSADKDLTSNDETTRELRTRLRVLIPGMFLRECMRWSSDRLEEVRNRTWKDLTGEGEQQVP